MKPRPLPNIPAIFVALSLGIVAVAWLVSLAGCQWPPSITPRPDATDAAIVGDADPGSDPCGLAEKRLRELQCRSAAGAPLWQTPGGIGFAAPCRDALADSPPRDWHPQCLARLAGCADYDRVFRGQVCP
jgi:hypothetical protein